MISYIKGAVSYLGENKIEITVNNIGYSIFVAGEILDKAKVGAEIELFCHQHVREDALDLFGFSSRGKLNLFEKLISVSGIGPKTALGVLNLATVDEITSAIIRGDASILTKVSGIGAKTAERIVLELKNKFKESQFTNLDQIKSADSDVLDALVGLGYQLADARSALRQVENDLPTDEKVKACLRVLAK